MRTGNILRRFDRKHGQRIVQMLHGDWPTTAQGIDRHRCAA
jgi:hypothetical protein